MKSKKTMYKQIYKVTYLANINKLIDEYKYIDVMQKLSTVGFKTYHINNFDMLTIHMKNIGLIDSFNISLLLYVRDTNYKVLLGVALRFDKIGKIFGMKRKKMVVRVHKIRKLLKEMGIMMKSFGKLEKKETAIAIIMKEGSILDNANKNCENIITREKIESNWIYCTRQDIMDRLHLLSQKHFTLEQLEFMGVKLILLSTLNNYSYEKLEKYYIYVVEKMEQTIKSWETICRLYVDIEVNYAECCQNILIGRKTKLTLKHFDLNVQKNFLLT